MGRRLHVKSRVGVRRGEGRERGHVHGCSRRPAGPLQSPNVINSVKCQGCCQHFPQLTVAMAIRCWREDINNNEDDDDR